MEARIQAGFVLLVCSFFSVIVAQRRQANNARDFDAENILEKFGYLDLLPEGVSRSEQTRSDAIREFQRFNGLSVNGNLNSETLTKMRQPRCGLPDVVRPSERNQGRRQLDPTQPLSFYAPGYKWKKNDLTYKFVGYTRKLGGSSQKRAIRNAFQKWSDVTPLTFRDQQSGTVDIEIDFARYNHGDGAGNSFDGRGKTLAHAFFPGESPISGDTHFDDDEEWTLGEDRGTNLEIVAAHEFGHALGLGHSNIPTALMAPYYQGYDPNYALHFDDKRGIQTLYGSRGRDGGRNTPRPTRPPRRTPRPTARPTRRPTRRPTQRPTRRPTQRPTGRHCDLNFDAIIVGHDQNTYVFRERKIYKLDPQGGVSSGFPKLTRRVYARAPSNIRAAVYDRTRGKLFFFKGSRYWRYTGYTLDPGYPRRIARPFRGARAAFLWRDGRIYLLMRDTYTTWTETLRRPPSGYPRRTADYWNGVRPGTEGAVRWRDGNTYFFKSRRYWKYDDYYQRVASGYPKDKAGPWLGCGGPMPK